MRWPQVRAALGVQFLPFQMVSYTIWGWYSSPMVILGSCSHGVDQWRLSTAKVGVGMQGPPIQGPAGLIHRLSATREATTMVRLLSSQGLLQK